MPSKRQPSKQRRAAQNKATRAQLEARRQRAGELRESAPSQPEAEGSAASDTAAPPPSSRPGGLLSGLFGGGREREQDGSPDDERTSARPAPRQEVNATGLIATLPDGSRLPGARAAFVAVVLAAVAFLFLLVIPLVKIDDRGERVPLEFEGLYLEARSLLERERVEAEEITLIEANGAGVVVVLLVPVVVAGFAWHTHRRTGASRPLTIGMLALAVVTVFAAGLGFYFMPALIALAVGSFQARKAELPARMAERVAAQRKDDEDENSEDVIDVEATEVTEGGTEGPAGTRDEEGKRQNGSG